MPNYDDSFLTLPSSNILVLFLPIKFIFLCAALNFQGYIFEWVAHHIKIVRKVVCSTMRTGKDCA